MLMCQPDTWAPLKDVGSDSLGLARDLDCAFLISSQGQRCGQSMDHS